MSIYDLEVAACQLGKVEVYAQEHGIKIVDVFMSPNFKNERRVRFLFPQGTFAAFQREFNCYVIKKLA